MEDERKGALVGMCLAPYMPHDNTNQVLGLVVTGGI